MHGVHLAQSDEPNSHERLGLRHHASHSFGKEDITGKAPYSLKDGVKAGRCERLQSEASLAGDVEGWRAGLDGEVVPQTSLDRRGCLRQATHPGGHP